MLHTDEILRHLINTGSVPYFITLQRELLEDTPKYIEEFKRNTNTLKAIVSQT